VAGRCDDGRGREEVVTLVVEVVVRHPGGYRRWKRRDQQISSAKEVRTRVRRRRAVAKRRLGVVHVGSQRQSSTAPRQGLTMELARASVRPGGELAGTLAVQAAGRRIGKWYYPVEVRRGRCPHARQSRRGSMEPPAERGGRKREGRKDLPQWREVMQFCITVGGGGKMPYLICIVCWSLISNAKGLCVGHFCICMSLLHLA
jgi:hypothetical protein